MTEEQTFAGDGRIATARLVLRAPLAADAAEMARLANDPRIAAMLPALPHPYGLEDAERFIADPGGEVVFSILVKDGMRLVGVCGLKLQAGDDSAELGFWIGRAFWGNGYATEAAQAVIDIGFRSLGLNAVHARCRAVNAASRQVIGKCGFQFRGSGMIESVNAGSFAGERYVMDRRCWASLKAWGRN